MASSTNRRTLALAIAGALAFQGAAHAQAVIELSQLDGTNGVAFPGIDANDEAGTAVSGVGDINGDGLNDILIGGPLASPDGKNLAGESYVVFGTDAGYPPTLELSDLDGTNGFTLKGSDAFDLSGIGVSAAGDVNGDGLEDLLIGANGGDPGGQSYAGETYVVFGRDSGFPATIALSSLGGIDGFVINGIDPMDNSGFAVSSAGDVNGDGVHDVLIGATGGDPGGRGDAGESYVVFGTDTGFPAAIDLSSLNGSNGFVLNGIDASDAAGVSVSPVGNISADHHGDVNGDGLDDILIGALAADAGGVNGAGESYVVLGTDLGFPAVIDLSSLNGMNGFALYGIDANDESGRSVSGAGDVNGDGLADLLIGARAADPNGNASAGESYVVFGRDTGFPAVIDLSSLDGSNGFVLNGIDASDVSGYSVSTAGDVNGDGFDDVLIGAYGASPGGRSGAGESYVVFGTDAGFPATFELDDLNGVNGFALNGINAGDLAGDAVSAAGDVNGDGVDDLLIGSDFASPGGRSSAGETYLVFGNAVPMASSPVVLLPPVFEDESDPHGPAIEDSAGVVYLDADPIGGLAVTGNASVPADGSWQYSGDGIVWTDVPASPDEASALVLNATDRLRFLPAPDYFGRPGELLVRLWDGRWRQPGPTVDIRNAIGALGGFATDDDLVAITVDVLPINDAPDFVAVDPPPENEDVGPVTVPGWAAFDPGPANEAGQVPLAYEVVAISEPELFRIEPNVDLAGNLVYEAAPDANGSATFDIRVVDDGGGDNGGIDISAFKTFTIDVVPVNDAPSLQAVDPPRVDPGAGPQTVPGWATFEPGAFNEFGQQPTYKVLTVGDPGLFDVLPSVDPAGTLTYTPVPGADGKSGFVVEVQDDGGTANGGQDTSPPFAFTIRVQGEVVFSNGFEQ